MEGWLRGPEMTPQGYDLVPLPAVRSLTKAWPGRHPPQTENSAKGALKTRLLSTVRSAQAGSFPEALETRGEGGTTSPVAAGGQTLRAVWSTTDARPEIETGGVRLHRLCVPVLGSPKILPSSHPGSALTGTWFAEVDGG